MWYFSLYTALSPNGIGARRCVESLFPVGIKRVYPRDSRPLWFKRKIESARLGLFPAESPKGIDDFRKDFNMGENQNGTTFCFVTVTKILKKVYL